MKKIYKAEESLTNAILSCFLCLVSYIQIIFMLFENSYKESAPERPEVKRSIFLWIDNLLQIEFLTQRRKPINYIPYVLYVTMLGIFYISNSHYAKKLQREIIQLEKEVTNLRSDYTHSQAKFMNAIKYSEVEKRAKQLGLERVEKVPYQIIVKKTQ